VVGSIEERWHLMPGDDHGYASSGKLDQNSCKVLGINGGYSTVRLVRQEAYRSTNDSGRQFGPSALST
jgi:hypothetical protein